MKLKLHIFGTALTLAALPVLAQTPTTPATCTTAPTSITTFNTERTLGLGTGSVFTNMTPNIPSDVLNSVTSGALEVREQASLNTDKNVLSFQAFTVAPGSPNPTPVNTIPSNSVLWRYQIQVENMYFSCQPVPSVLIVGKMTTNYPVTPFGSLNGSLVAVGLGYTTDDPPKINNFTVLVPGVAGLYSGEAMGTLEFPTSPVTPPGTSGVPTIVFTPGAEQSTAQKQMVLDVSKSTDPNNLQLTFAWTQVNMNVPAGIANANTAMPLVTFSGGKGDYIFEVTATNSKGATATAQTTIHYYGQ